MQTLNAFPFESTENVSDVAILSIPLPVLVARSPTTRSGVDEPTKLLFQSRIMEFLPQLILWFLLKQY